MTARRTAARTTREPAAHLPVARVMVDVALAHLDRPFDYLVPTTLDEQARAGSRVRVRFAGRLVDGYLLDRAGSSDHGAKLAYLERVVGEPVLTAETAALFRAVADRWAGSFVDVARLGVPPRHARAETSAAAPSPPLPGAPAATGFDAYRAGPAFLAALSSRRAARAVWSALPGEAWPDRLAEAALVALADGRGSILIVPDVRDLQRLDEALEARLGAGHHVVLAAEVGPAERYRRWLAVRRGAVRVVAGTRAAAYAPVADLGLLAIWDDGDDLYDEPRAPYAHARDVLVLRSAASRAALLIGGHARTAEAQRLAESGWAHEIAATRDRVRASAPRVVVTGDETERARDEAAATARLPSLAWRTARDALAEDAPVLVQVPRGGYVPSLACARDRTPARCAECGGPLGARSGTAPAACRWCGKPAGDWTCPACGGRRMRAQVVGSARTAEELGRAFPGVNVRTSGGDHVLGGVDARPAVVVATPGAEPPAEGGYGAALLLDGWAMLGRADLRAGEEALRRWLNAAALVRPGGRVIVAADSGVAAVQALVRWDPAGAAARELADRQELGFPPATRMAAVSGRSGALAQLLDAAPLPEGSEVIGPVPDGEDGARALVRVRREDGTALARALKVATAARSARKDPEPVRVVLDPARLG